MKAKIRNIGEFDRKHQTKVCSNSIDTYILNGQTFEVIEYFKLSFMYIYRILIFHCTNGRFGGICGYTSVLGNNAAQILALSCFKEHFCGFFCQNRVLEVQNVQSKFLTS